jgi:exodeoxyribonuclease-3
MRIVTYNVNGITGRLPVLLRWLKEEQPDIACLQELRAPQEKFPEDPLKAAATGPSGTARKAGMASLF